MYLLTVTAVKVIYKLVVILKFKSNIANQEILMFLNISVSQINQLVYPFFGSRYGFPTIPNFQLNLTSC